MLSCYFESWQPRKNDGARPVACKKNTGQRIAFTVGFLFFGVFSFTRSKSPKVGKNVDKSLIIAAGCQSQTMLLFGVACYHNLL